MYRRVKKKRAPVEGSMIASKGLLTEPRAVLADLGFRIKQDAQGEGIDAVVDQKSDTVSVPTAGLTTALESTRKALSLHWEELTYCTSRLVQETLQGRLPAPWLSTPSIADIESQKHWTEQCHENTRKRGYSLVTLRLPRDATEEYCELLASPNHTAASKLVLLIPGGSCPLTVWNRNLLLQGPLASGSVVSAVDQILKVFGGCDPTSISSWASLDTAVIIANPGERYWVAADGARPGRAVTSEFAQFRHGFKLIQSLASAEAHVGALLQGYVLPSKATKIFVMAAAASANALVACLGEHFDAITSRICAIGLLQPQHHVRQLSQVNGYAEWFQQRTLSIAMAVEESNDEQTHQELIAAAKSGKDDEPVPDLRKGCLVIASSATKVDLLALRGPARLVEFFRFRDQDGDLTPMLAQVDELASLEMARNDREAAVTVGGLQGWWC